MSCNFIEIGGQWNHNIAMDTPKKGRCVVCGVEGDTDKDFVCSRCVDPDGVLMFRERCHTRYSLEPEKTLQFLHEYGYRITDPRFLVLKVSACSECLAPDETAQITVLRVHIPLPDSKVVEIKEFS